MERLGLSCMGRGGNRVSVGQELEGKDTVIELISEESPKRHSDLFWQQ